MLAQATYMLALSQLTTHVQANKAWYVVAMVSVSLSNSG